VVAAKVVLYLAFKHGAVFVFDVHRYRLHQQYILSMIPLKAWYTIQPKKAQQHTSRNISMSSCVRQYSTALSHSLLMLTSIASAKPTEILWPTLGCLKHTCRDEDACNQQDMGNGTDTKGNNTAKPHAEDNTPHPSQHLHYHVACVHVGYVGQRVVPPIHD
jgi:hypothetical protein